MIEITEQTVYGGGFEHRITASNEDLVVVLEELPGRTVAVVHRADDRLLIVVDERKSNAWAHAQELLYDMTA